MRKSISSELLTYFENEGENFLSQIVTADESWVHHFERGGKMVIHGMALS
jgi:hypothetical protein